jgi:hypothetical protein
MIVFGSVKNEKMILVNATVSEGNLVKSRRSLIQFEFDGGMEEWRNGGMDG